MGYDIYVGATFSNATHVVSIEERLFDKFVEAHTGAIPRFALLTRMRDPYGDADYLPSELGKLVLELVELERMCAGGDVKSLCKTLRSAAEAARRQSAGLYGRGD